MPIENDCTTIRYILMDIFIYCQFNPLGHLLSYAKDISLHVISNLADGSPDDTLLDSMQFHVEWTA